MLMAGAGSVTGVTSLVVVLVYVVLTGVVVSYVVDGDVVVCVVVVVFGLRLLFASLFDCVIVPTRAGSCAPRSGLFCAALGDVSFRWSCT